MVIPSVGDVAEDCRRLYRNRTALLDAIEQRLAHLLGRWESIILLSRDVCGDPVDQGGDGKCHHAADQEGRCDPA